MTKTQIQLPDDMYERAKRLAARQEWSLAELCRRGIEYILSVYPEGQVEGERWRFPDPVDLGDQDPFADPDWRVRHNQRMEEEILGSSRGAAP